MDIDCYDTTICCGDCDECKIFEELDKRETRRKLIRLAWFLVLCGLAGFIVYWFIFIFMSEGG